jgi:hypothetical protein
MIDWFDVWWSVYKAGRRALVLFAWANLVGGGGRPTVAEAAGAGVDDPH